MSRERKRSRRNILFQPPAIIQSDDIWYFKPAFTPSSHTVRIAGINSVILVRSSTVQYRDGAAGPGERNYFHVKRDVDISGRAEAATLCSWWRRDSGDLFKRRGVTSHHVQCPTLPGPLPSRPQPAASQLPSTGPVQGQRDITPNIQQTLTI